MWEAIEASTREAGMREAERRRSKGGSREKERRKGKEEKTEKGENSRSQENNGGVENIGRRRRGSKIGSGSKKISTRKISLVDKSIW